MRPCVFGQFPDYPCRRCGTVDQDVFHGLCGIACGAALACFVIWDVPPELTDLLDSMHGLE